MMDNRFWIWSQGLERWDEIVEPEKFTLTYFSRKFCKGQVYCVYKDATGRYVAITLFDLGAI